MADFADLGPVAGANAPKASKFADLGPKKASKFNDLGPGSPSQDDHPEGWDERLVSSITQSKPYRAIAALLEPDPTPHREPKRIQDEPGLSDVASNPAYVLNQGFGALDNAGKNIAEKLGKKGYPKLGVAAGAIPSIGPDVAMAGQGLAKMGAEEVARMEEAVSKGLLGAKTGKITEAADAVEAARGVTKAKWAARGIERGEGAVADLKAGERGAQIRKELTGAQPPPQIIPVKPVEIKGSPATTAYLERLKRLAEGPRTALDLAMERSDAILAAQAEEQAGEVRKLLSSGSQIKMTAKEMGQASELVGQAMDAGASTKEIAEATGVSEKVIRGGANLRPPIDTSDLALQHAAANGDQAAGNNLLQRAVKYFFSSKTEASSGAANLFKRRYGEIGVGHFESMLFVRSTTKGLSSIERQALPFIIEGELPDAARFTHPKAGEILTTAKKYLENPEHPAFANLKAAADKIGAYYEEGHKFLSEHFDEIGYRENYVNHLWNKAPQVREPSKGSLSPKNPFAKERYIGSYAEGINQGLQPRTLDIGELLGVYDNFKIKSVANQKFIQSLKDIRLANGLPAVLPADAAPADWMAVDNLSLRLNGKPVKVSPEVAPAVRAIIEKPFAFTNPGPHASLGEKAWYVGANAYEYVNSIFKKTKLSLSFFHHYSLSETGLAGGINPAKAAMRQMKGILNGAEYDGIRDMPGALYQAFKEGHAAFENIPLAKRALKAGVDLGPISDVQSSRIRNLLIEVENRVKPTLAKRAVGAVRTFNDVWDKALWDYFHSSIKLNMFESHLAQNIQKFGATMPMEQIEQETAAFVNKATGGAMDAMMVSPRYKQIAHWAMLAPDWTITRLQTFGAMFKGGPQGYQARKFWLRAGTAYFSAANAMNYVQTEKHLGKGRFIWDNDPGKKLAVFWGKDENGRNQYITPAKTMTEVLGWFTEPLKLLGNKASPSIHILAEALSGETRTLGGFPIAKKDRTVLGFAERHILPMSTGQNNIGMTFPLSKGMSKSAVIDLMQSGFESGDGDKIARALQFGVENGYDVGSLKSIAYRNYRQGIKQSALQATQ